ncbi:VOC family protein [Corynebacterium halotolerans]|uniref:Glyoxalase/fosfomycin resistance/dioxygenase domain-containing protein n=1 Tax=Corynebacterium halotolerans YIM 70093 = DSM 44683 TaxID=1121362 RepID=M1NVJ7_9CORY|nr:VOC family protein [Corynebacterium halotolerans]AGF73487.1 hypothetical protein A605_12455 [Corynebacterium halotolerans YIM 70093 = DSM 44683]
MSLRFLPYISFPGNAAEAMSHYHEIFGGDLQVLKYADTDTTGFPFTPSPEAVAHAQLEADGLLLSGGDAVGEDNPPLSSDVYSFLLSFDTTAEAEEMIGKFTSRGGEVTMPFEPAPWGDHYGQLTDRFGVVWAFDVPGGAG